jgi:hypothetical protein
MRIAITCHVTEAFATLVIFCSLIFKDKMIAFSLISKGGYTFKFVTNIRCEITRMDTPSARPKPVACK